MYQSGQYEVEQSSEWEVSLIIGKLEKKMQETAMGGLQVITTPATSVFLSAFLYQYLGKQNRKLTNNLLFPGKPSIPSTKVNRILSLSP